MGKKTPKYPQYSSGSVSINGETKATSQRDSKNNLVNTNYNMSDIEQKVYDSIQNNMYSSLGNLFDISDNQREQWGQQLNALKTTGIDNINDIYTPMETNLRNNIASRFGNLDNSIFLNNLNSITNKRAKAVADLSNSLLSAQDSLYNQELANRINTLSFLNSLNTSFNNNMMNYINAAANNSSAGNNYNQNAYNAAYSAYSNSLANPINAINSATKVVSTVAPFFKGTSK